LVQFSFCNKGYIVQFYLFSIGITFRLSIIEQLYRTLNMRTQLSIIAIFSSSVILNFVDECLAIYLFLSENFNCRSIDINSLIK
jgi:hypothetical protein